MYAGGVVSELNCHSHSLFANPTYVSKHVLVGDLNGIKQVVDHRHKITCIFVGIGWDRESITLCSILEIKKNTVITILHVQDVMKKD